MSDCYTGELNMNESSLRAELSDVAFEDLQKIEAKVGSKFYNEALFGVKSSKATQKRQNTDERQERKKRAQARRKDMPVELSSKRPAQAPKNIMHAKKQVFRDPRFDDLSGEFDEKAFHEDYGFIKDIQERERKTVEKELKKCSDEEESARLKKLLYRMNQQDIAQKKKERQRNIEDRLKSEETNLVKQGKKPYFLKKGDKKILELAEQYKDLKKSGKLDKYLAKKRKKNIAKDRGQMPTTS